MFCFSLSSDHYEDHLVNFCFCKMWNFQTCAICNTIYWFCSVQECVFPVFWYSFFLKTILFAFKCGSHLQTYLLKLKMLRNLTISGFALSPFLSLGVVFQFLLISIFKVPFSLRIAPTWPHVMVKPSSVPNKGLAIDSNPAGSGAGTNFFLQYYKTILRNLCQRGSDEYYGRWLKFFGLDCGYFGSVELFPSGHKLVLYISTRPPHAVFSSFGTVIFSPSINKDEASVLSLGDETTKDPTGQEMFSDLMKSWSGSSKEVRYCPSSKPLPLSEHGKHCFS